MPLPGDDLVPGATVVIDRAFRLAAPPAAVWPWVVQLGRKRAGWYAPRSVEAFVPARLCALRVLDPALTVAVGDEIPDWGPRTSLPSGVKGEPTFVAVVVDAPHTLVYRSDRPRGTRPPLVFSWAIALRGEQTTTVHFRLRIGGVKNPFLGVLGGLFDAATIAVLHRGLVERVER